MDGEDMTGNHVVAQAVVMVPSKDLPKRVSRPISEVCIEFEAFPLARLPSCRCADGAWRSQPSAPPAVQIASSSPEAPARAVAPPDPITLTKAKRCSDVSVKVLVEDVIDYPIPAKKPEFEIGKLIDDIRVKAILLADVDDLVNAPPMLDNDQAKLNYHRIAEAAAWAGVEPSDIQPGGKYFPLMVEMMGHARWRG